MTIRWWTPMTDLVEASRSMDRLFDTFFGAGGATTPTPDGSEVPTYYLPVDVVDTRDEYVLSAAVPGFSPEQVEVTWHEGLLTIFAKAEPTELTGQWLRRERPYGNFVRRLQLPDRIYAEQIRASFDNGVLSVHVPKVPEPEPVKIPIGGSHKQLTAKS